MSPNAREFRSYAPFLVRICGVSLVIAWTGWVAWNYGMVDGGALAFPNRRVTLVFVIGGFVAMMVGGLVGIICRSPVRTGVRTSAASCLAILVFVAWSKFAEIVLAQSDFARVTLLLLLGAAGGAGFTLAVRDALLRRDFAIILLLTPFGILSFIADLGTSFLCTLITLVAAAGLGRTLLDKLGWNTNPGVSEHGLTISIRLALGLLALGCIGFLLGLGRLAHPPVLLIAVVLAIFLTRRAMVLEFTSWRNWLSTPAPNVGSGCWVAGAVWALLLIGWIGALAPEVGPDAIGGRMALVRMWARDGTLAGYEEMTLSYMATAGETLFLTMFPLAGDQSAKLGQFAAVLAFLPALSGIVRHRTVSAGILLLAFGTSSLVLVQFAWGFVDLLQAFYYFAAVAAGSMWWRRSHRGLLFAAGLLAGGAAAVKLNGVGAVLIIGVVVAARHFRAPRPLRPFLHKDYLILASSGFLIAGPWLVRSYLLTGNPIFPYANNIFASPIAPPELIAARLGDPFEISALIRIPWNIFFAPESYAEIGTYHPLLLCMLPLAVFALSCARTRYWILTGLAAGLLWLATEQNLRYSLFAGLLIISGISLWLDQWLIGRSPAQRSLAAVVLTVLFFGGTYAQLARPTSWLFRFTDAPAMPLSVALGQVSRDDYLASQLPHVPLLRHLDQTIGNDAVVWQAPFLRDHLHLSGRAIALPHCDYRLSLRLRPLLDLTPSPENFHRIHAALRELGITHLLLPPHSPWAPAAPNRTVSAIFSHEFYEHVAILEAANYGYILLALKSGITDQSEEVLGPNLLKNPSFAFSRGAASPENWTANTLLPAPGNQAFALPDGATLYQSATVQPGKLYRLDVSFSPMSPEEPAPVLHTAWRNPDDKLILYQSNAVIDTQTSGLMRIFQTAPSSATTLDVTLQGPIVPISIAVQTVDFAGKSGHQTSQ